MQILVILKNDIESYMGLTLNKTEPEATIIRNRLLENWKTAEKMVRSQREKATLLRLQEMFENIEFVRERFAHPAIH